MGEFQPGDIMRERTRRVHQVLDTIPQNQYVDGYIDPTGKAGFRNPVRPVVGDGLTAVVKKLQIVQGVELGAALGRSGLHMALGGLQELDTVEFDSEAARTAQANFNAAGLRFMVHNMDSGDFTRTWADPIDFLFIDHAKERYLEDFQTLEPYLSPTALILMDNTFNRASECKDAVAYVADRYYASIFTEPSTGGETTGLLIASLDRQTFDTAFNTFIDVRSEA